MTITDQIIEAADSLFRFNSSNIQRKASNLIKADQTSFYTLKYQEYSKIINESKYSAKLPLKHILKFNAYEEIMEAIYYDFYPLSPRRQIEFQETGSKTPVMGAGRMPIVNKTFDFSRDTEKGQEITTYLTNLFILRWLKSKMGYDINCYPNKEYLVVFEYEGTVFIWKREITNSPRLYIDKSGNKEILKIYHNIYFHLGFGVGKLTPLLEELPYLEDDEAQKEFDNNWYKAKKQSPLTYRCFPNTFTAIVRPDPNPDLCKHAGEYCIEKEEMDERFARFMNVYNAIDKSEQQTLITNSIDYFEKFLKTDCFEKTIHKQHFEDILLQLQNLKPTKSNQISSFESSEKTIKSFSDYLIGSDKLKAELLKVLIADYKGKKGRNIAIMILALEANKRIAYDERAELYRTIRLDFGNIGADSGINNYLTPTKRNDEDQKRTVELHTEKIKKQIENFPK